MNCLFGVGVTVEGQQVDGILTGVLDETLLGELDELVTGLATIDTLLGDQDSAKSSDVRGSHGGTRHLAVLVSGDGRLNVVTGSEDINGLSEVGEGSSAVVL